MTQPQKLQRFYEANEKVALAFYWFAGSLLLYLILFALPLMIAIINQDILFVRDNTQLIQILHILRGSLVLFCANNLRIVATQYRDVLFLQCKDVTGSHCTCKDTDRKYLFFQNREEGQQSYHQAHITWSCDACGKTITHCYINRKGHMTKKI